MFELPLSQMTLMHHFEMSGEFSLAKKIIAGTQMTMRLKSNSINYLNKNNLMCFAKF